MNINPQSYIHINTVVHAYHECKYIRVTALYAAASGLQVLIAQVAILDA